MIGLLRRGDDGLTDRQRRRMAEEYARTLGATPRADVFARARARHLTSRALTLPGYVPAPQGAGPDAAAERWLAVPGFDGYEVSDQGRVRSWRSCWGTSEPRLLKQWRNSDGYLTVNLQLDGRKVPPRRVHLLVLAAFAGPRPGGMETRHLDGNPANNTLANLRYGTPVENARDQRRHGTQVELSKTHCPQGHPYDEANTYRDSAGKRYCRECRHIRAMQRTVARRRARAERRAAA